MGCSSSRVTSEKPTDGSSTRSAIRSCEVLAAEREPAVSYLPCDASSSDTGSMRRRSRSTAAWRSLSWKLWIDGQQVSLSRFGHADRWIQADGRNVVLREWSIILVGAKGRHSIRYRTRGPQGVGDTTWRFSLANN